MHNEHAVFFYHLQVSKTIMLGALLLQLLEINSHFHPEYQRITRISPQRRDEFASPLIFCYPIRSNIFASKSRHVKGIIKKKGQRDLTGEDGSLADARRADDEDTRPRLQGSGSALHRLDEPNPVPPKHQSSSRVATATRERERERGGRRRSRRR